MEKLEELIPFAKEMLSQKPSRGLLRVYLVGSVFAVLGTVIGLVETVCHPFYSRDESDAEMLLMWEQRTVKVQCSVHNQEEEEEEEEKKLARKNESTTQILTLSKIHGLGQRSMANRLHAS
ncbi:G0/G1 switch protein 2 [Antennarius striatus]|uniref:G0/G1 switch protein 2 n=1 Tax=Antennarius striatus TaxID=241820 RepID=UPI0035AFC8E1